MVHSRSGTIMAVKVHTIHELTSSNLVIFNAYAINANVVQLRLFLLLCVRPCITNVITISWKWWNIFSPNFQHWCILGQGWMCQVLWSKGRCSRSRWSPTCWKMHFLALLMQYLENYWTEFQQTFSINVFWDKDELVNFGGQKVKDQGHSMTEAQQSDAYRVWSCVLSSNF